MAENDEMKMNQNNSTASDKPNKSAVSNSVVINKDMEDFSICTTNECKDAESHREHVKKKANQLFLMGKRNILIHDYLSAVKDLGSSCNMFRYLYGEKADEMADPYFYYGKALFELARNESEVLGEQIQDEADKGDDEDDDDADEDGDNNDDDDDGDKNDGTEEEAVEKEVEGELKKEDSTGDNKNVTGEDEEEVNDLQLSWEYLELAKFIYKRNSDNCKETAIKLAEVYLLLGENGLESENYQTAIEDMQQALELQQKVLPEEDRRIAETYYHLGVAYSLNMKFDEAITHFKSAIAQLQKKITSLEERKKAGDQKTEEEKKDAFYTMEGEIESIRSIITEIEEKISDMNNYKDEVKAEALKQVISGSGPVKDSTNSDNSGATSSSSKSIPVTDISHLIRKKRKNDSEDESNTKKPKQENSI